MSGDFPHVDRNLNTGLPRATRGMVAEQTVFHDATRPSMIILRTVSQLGRRVRTKNRS
jgi:predicted acyl esterase